MLRNAKIQETTGARDQRRRQLMAYGVMSIISVALFGVLVPSQRALFLPYFGSLHPLLVIAIVIALGTTALPLLWSRGRFQVLRAETGLREMALAAGLATLFAIEVVVADTLIRYPENMNAPLPQALGGAPRRARPETAASGTS